MRIGFVKMTPLGGSAGLSGVASVVADWTGELHRRGHESFVFALKDYLSCREGAVIRYGRTLFGDPGLARELDRWMAEREVDILHLHTSLLQTSRLIRRPLPRPTVQSLHTFEIVCPLCTKRLPDGEPCRRSPGWACVVEGCRSVRRYLMHDVTARAIRRDAGKYLARLIAHNRALEKTLLENETGAPATYVPLGIDTGMFTPGDSPRDKDSVLYVGRLRPEKGVDVLVRAMAQVVKTIRGARLIIIGGGEEESRLRSLAERSGVERAVEFVEAVPRLDLRRHFSAAAVSVLPSLWEENFGMAGLEAMASGLPVVASNVAGIREWLHDGVCGVTVPPGDVGALAEAITGILSNPSRRAAMGVAARRRATELDVNRSVDALLSVYAEVLDRDARRRNG